MKDESPRGNKGKVKAKGKDRRQKEEEYLL
jgi:hypothetical protein